MELSDGCMVPPVGTDGRWPSLHPSDERKGFPVQGKLSPEVTDELFIRSVRRTRYLPNKEKINRQLIRFLRNHLPLHGEGFRAARIGQTGEKAPLCKGGSARRAVGDCIGRPGEQSLRHASRATSLCTREAQADGRWSPLHLFDGGMVQPMQQFS